MREDIDVFQGKKDFIAYCKTFTSETYLEVMFGKGAFIIPFSGDVFTDTLIISIIYDYNQTHELKIMDHIRSEAYLLMEKIDIDCDKLNEPTIAQHFGKSVRYGWPTYLEIADAGGFYSFDFLLDNEASRYLNNTEYSVFMWPYRPDPASTSEQINSLLNVRDTNAIRKFIYDGGGFIGTCWGAYAGSSGFILPGVVTSLRFSYTPQASKIFPSVALSISDSLMTVNFRVFKELIQVNHTILKPNHQLFYTINGTFFDFFLSPIFIWTGRNTEILTAFDRCKTFLGDPITDRYTERIISGRPGFIHSTFGEGDVVLFSSHPDFVNNIIPLFSGDIQWQGDRYYGRRIIFNSLFYVTSKKNTTPVFSYASNISFVNLVSSKTNDLPINNESTNQFSEIIYDMDILCSKLTTLNVTLTKIKYLFTLFLEESTFFPNNYIFSYSSYLTNILKHYLNTTRSTLIELNNIVPMISGYNESILDDVELLQRDMKNRLTTANELLLKVTRIAQNIVTILESDNITMIQKTDLLIQRRELLSSFGIELKYIPQLFFDSEKMLRTFWYKYEAFCTL